MSSSNTGKYILGLLDTGAKGAYVKTVGTQTIRDTNLLKKKNLSKIVQNVLDSTGANYQFNLRSLLEIT